MYLCYDVYFAIYVTQVQEDIDDKNSANLLV